MDLEDVIDPEYGLQQDEYSLSNPKFGKDNQLEVVGWSGKNGVNKLYIVKCKVCCQDPELFGEGYFIRQRKYITRGILPCRCSKMAVWSEEQYAVLCTRKAFELGYKFLGFCEEWRRNTTKIKMECPDHGVWDSGTIADLTNKDVGCPRCKIDIIRACKLKPDQVMIQSFFASGAFHPDTKFWRSDRKSGNGWQAYWHVYCPDCDGVGEAYSGNLQRGCRACDCYRATQKECYINIVGDDDQPIALKFGISSNSELRQFRQDYLSIYQVLNHSIYSFPTTVTCKRAERICKQELQCGILTKEEMPDGYTETTWLYNLEKIVEIYERNGGILNDRQ